MLDIMYEVPSNPNIEECIIDEAVIEQKAPPKMVMNSNPELTAKAS